MAKAVDFDAEGAGWVKQMQSAAEHLSFASGGCSGADVYMSTRRAREALREAKKGIAILERALEGR